MIKKNGVLGMLVLALAVFGCGDDDTSDNSGMTAPSKSLSIALRVVMN